MALNVSGALQKGDYQNLMVSRMNLLSCIWKNANLGSITEGKPASYFGENMQVIFRDTSLEPNLYNKKVWKRKYMQKINEIIQQTKNGSTKLKHIKLLRFSCFYLYKEPTCFYFFSNVYNWNISWSRALAFTNRCMIQDLQLSLRESQLGVSVNDIRVISCCHIPFSNDFSQNVKRNS